MAPATAPGTPGFLTLVAAARFELGLNYVILGLLLLKFSAESVSLVVRC